MATLLAFMTILMFIQVLMRYLFSSGWVWSLEAIIYSFAALVLVGMSYGVRTGTHIAVDVVVARLPPRIQKTVALIAVSICVIYACLMFYGAINFVDRLMTFGNMARDIPVPKWLLTVSMPLGFSLLIFRFLEAGWALLNDGDNADAK